MHKVVKIIIIYMLICCITFVSYSADLNELNDKKNEIQTQIDESSSKLADVDEELTQNLQQIQKLDESIQSTEQSLQEVNLKILAMEEEVSNVEKEIENITQKYNNQKELSNSRLVAMYETEDTNYLDVMLKSSSISDFLSSYYLISEITSYDIELLELVENEKQQIEQKQAILSSQKEKLEQERHNVKKTQITLSNTKLLRENYLYKLSEEERNLQAKIDEYNSQVNEIEKEIRSLALTINFGEDYSGGTMMWPIAGHYTITSDFGMRVHPITGVYKLHTGVDIGASMGTDFTAIANGIVVKAEYNGAYGNMVVIDHGGGVQTLYAHGSEIIASVGQEVKAGDVVLKVGSTGYSTGPHAHFEVRVNGTPVNPLDYITKPE